ncbi:MAG: fatty acid desaturase [Bacteroidales bacterium]
MGILIGFVIIVCWAANLFYSLTYVSVDVFSFWTWLHVALQSYLFTGLFITGHDAMHGTVSSKKTINKIFGWVTVFLFAGMSYARLIKNHKSHHITPAAEGDPDFNMKSQNFWLWWFSFMWHYITIWQLVIMALLFNILKIWFDSLSLVVYWIVPAFIGTLQLFYFGTYLPHRLPHESAMMPHKARTQRKNHLWAMLSCYFFGYHYEHHEYPKTPWWQLYKKKENA